MTEQSTMKQSEKINNPGLVLLNTLLAVICLVCAPKPAQAQRYQLTSGEIYFYSEAPLEDIEATNKQVQSIFDAATGELAYIVKIKGFQFEKSLMQEHFNENYLESDKYPTATFEGKIAGFDPERTGKQQATAKGMLTIHGLSHPVEIPGSITTEGNTLRMNAKFPVKLADYDIEIPKVVFYNIAEVVDVTVNLTYQHE